MLIKALGKALVAVPECNVTFAGNELIKYSRADISVAVSIPGGLITPIVQDADGRSLSSIAKATKDPPSAPRPASCCRASTRAAPPRSRTWA
jgi:pyruvate dehydrogenase E2 component (dihydrolipoamide acetyltransferase)